MVAAKGLALIPDRLFWAPGESKSPEGRSDINEIDALELCKHAGGKGTSYGVVHYTRAACGAAFGPLSLASLMHFCRGLDAAFEKGAAVALLTPKADTASRLNALVLVGGYLIVKHAWSAERLAHTIGQEAAKSKFICSWSRSATPEPERVMTVMDCWAGLELAYSRGWLRAAEMEDDLKLEAAVSRYQLRAFCFDATWIIPGLLMVASDPTTVVYDPNPATCKQMIPKDGMATCSTCTPDKNCDFSDQAADDDDIKGPVGRGSLCSVDTVCKEYNENYEDTMPCDPSSAPADYATFMVQSGVGMVVRVNFDDEEGMPRESYRNDTFEAFGIEHANIRVVDTHGGIPKPEDVRRMLEICDSYLDPLANVRPAVLVHCKGGFGRSMVLAACLAIYRFDLPGAALLGWGRVARPGTITVSRQETFLKQLRGRTDVMRYAKMPPEGGMVELKSSTSCTSCALQ